MTEYLPLEHPWMGALAACIVAAALEGLLAGVRVKARFAELRQPPFAPPLWAWSIVGFLYYVLFFLVLHSLLRNPPTPAWTSASLALVAILLAANAAWNWVFFRKKDLRQSLIFFAPYLLAALALALALHRLRSPLAAWYLLYVGYLAYAAWWCFRVWRLNLPSKPAV
jgi:tryptophan-rich sensory protein